MSLGQKIAELLKAYCDNKTTIPHKTTIFPTGPCRPSRVKNLVCLFVGGVVQCACLIPYPSVLQVIEEKGTENATQGKGEDEMLPCPICFKAFRCKSDLETHMDTHPDSSLRYWAPDIST